MKSWKHQEAAVERFKDKEIAGLLFDCGTGKTRTAIKLAEAKGMPVLIIAPKSLCSQWGEAIAEHSEAFDNDILVFDNAKKNTAKAQRALEDFLNK